MTHEMNDDEAWVTGDIAGHVQTLAARIGDAAIDNPPEVVKWSQRHSWVEIHEQGNLMDGSLCWVCGAERRSQGGLWPSPRACVTCSLHDRRLAGGLGLLGLLPLDDRVLASPVPDAIDGELREVVLALRSDVSLLDRWRRTLVRLTAEEIGRGDQRLVCVIRWREALSGDEAWSRTCWQDFLTAHYPPFSRLAVAHLRRERGA